MTKSFESELPGPEAFDTDTLARGIIEWVEFETPSDRLDLIDRFLDHVEGSFSALDVTATRLPAQGGCGGQLVLSYDPQGTGAPPALLMGHIDTVWDAGTLAARPVRVEGDRIHGPGIFDMKAGSFLATETLRNIARKRIVPPRPITVFLNSDEETGSIASRKTIEELSADAAFVLVPEPSFGDPGTLVTARKGWARFTLTVHGRSAHAGGNLRDGRSAIHEIARQIADIEAINDADDGVTFNVGTVRGGTRTNVVPDLARIEVDMRADDMAAAERHIALMLARKPFGPEVTVEVEGGLNRPPFERTPEVVRLYEATRSLGRHLGLDLGETSRGGVSDGNFAAALGRPVLDGLGCNGAGAHAVDEHILRSTIGPRAALFHAMLTSEAFNARLSG